MRWGNNRGGVGIYDPMRVRPGQETYVFSAADKTRNQILDLEFTMNLKVSEYLKYRKVGKLPPLSKEEAQRCVQELFSLIRESVVRWLDDRRRKLEKMNKRDEVALRVLKEDEAVLKGLDLLDEGADARDEFLIVAKRFLNRYTYDRGITKLERERGDPVEDYSRQAYGDDYGDEQS